MTKLSEKSCKPCHSDTNPLKGDEVTGLKDKIDTDWKVIDDHHLVRDFTFNDFKQALDFTNRVGAIAEEEQHHPDIFLTYGKVEIKIWTHNIGGLSENDFILASKIDELETVSS